MNSLTKNLRASFNAKALAIVAATAAAMAAVPAHAAAVTVDVADTVSSLQGGIASITAIGVAVLALIVVVKLFGFVKRAL
jgi:Inovirus Coat protein B